MFTGIIEEVGTVTEVLEVDGDLRLFVSSTLVTEDLSLGDSISVSGCCLTASRLESGGFWAELTGETVTKTAPRWRKGSRVNLERALRADGRFGGHMVSGHVEGVARVTSLRREPGAFVLTLRAPERLARYLVPKGSVTIDGVSLTVVDTGGPGGSDPDLAPSDFTLWLIPHTLQVTTLAELEPASVVNLEADLIAKYLERLQLAKEPVHVP